MTLLFATLKDITSFQRVCCEKTITKRAEMAHTQKNESVPVRIRLAAVALLLPILAMSGVKAQVSEELFMDPPIEARPNTYWEWMNGNISKEGLTKDLEYMKQANYGAAMIFEAGVGIPKGAVDCNTPLWKEMIAHAVKEASRLGLKLGMHNAPGYSGTGGPWIPVEHSMKQLVWTESFAVSDGTKSVDIVLPRPFSKSDFYRDAYILAYPSLPHEGKCFSDVVARMTLDGKEMEHRILSDNDLTTQIRMEKGQCLLFELNEDFDMQSVTVFRGEREQPLDPHDGPRDYAPSLSVEVSQDNVHFVKTGNVDCPPLRAMDVPGILTFPPVKVRYVRLTSNRGTNLAEIDFHSSPRLNNYTAKTNCVNAAVGLEENRQEVSSADIIPSGEVVDLTGKIDPNGHLAWKAPKGKWTIVRIGYTTTGETVAAAPDAGSGPDCDKFSKEALDVHFDRFLDPLLDSMKPYCGTVSEVLAIDSWEAGKQNWTEKLPVYFMQKRGYDIMPWMLAVTGRIVDSVGETERFLWDFRRTHTDMFLDNYVRHFKERISRYGLKYAGEAYGDGNFESLEMAAEQDIPMSEFWTH